MEPQEPVEIWLRWVAVLVANAFPESLSDTQKVCLAEVQSDHSRAWAMLVITLQEIYL